MNSTGTRYRGAQPFADDYVSQRTFFGRQEAVISLTNQVLANRLVVVYAKSGIGKSSLLNAGIAPRLREAGYQPLLVRVSDIRVGPIVSVVLGVRSEAERQKVEYVDDDTTSLWRFFKTIEFWRGDSLLTPVLIVDQFEELFTLHSESARDAFLTELSYVVRGVRPPSPTGPESRLSDTAPSLHVVLSVREDFLGVLEDAADRIPQIMDHRFRLVALSRQNASEAMSSPAMISDPALATQPFTLAPEFTATVLDYLTMQQMSGTSSGPKRQVEPFHLQLICQRVEQIVAAQGGMASRAEPFNLIDFGGVAALSDTLKSFYTNAIQSVSESHLRPVARRLCEEFLISPEGRRLSLEQYELRRQLGLSDLALKQLVESRLLRTDRRSDSTYYELSHDALVEPVLATRRIQALLLGWAAIVFGSIAMCILGFFILAFLIDLAPDNRTDRVVAAIFVVCALGLFLVPLRIVKMGVRTHRRFRWRSSSDAPQAIPTFARLRDRILGRTLIGVGLTILLATGGVYLLGIFLVIALFYGGGRLPTWLNSMESPELLAIYQRPVQELSWWLVESTTVLVFGAMLWRMGRRRLDPATPSLLMPSWPWLASFDLDRAWTYGSALLFVVAVTGAYVLERCTYSLQGRLPDWLPEVLLSVDIQQSCRALFEGRYWSSDNLDIALFLVSAFCLSLPGLWHLLRRLYRALRPTLR